MPAQVIITVAAGPSSGQQFAFAERTTALIGRGKECHIRFPKDRDHQSVSRHHCLLDINPPEAAIRDLGSRRGTLVNGGLIGMRAKAQTAEEGARLAFDQYRLKNGDEITLGDVTLRLAVTQPSSAPDPHATVDYRPSPGQVDPEQVARRLLDQAQAGALDLRPLAGWRFDHELGRGGMGAVFLIKHMQTRHGLALKLMLPQAAATDHHRDLFLREVANMKSLSHRHVVQLFDFGCWEGNYFFTQEYCDGGSVADLLRKRGKLTPQKAVPLTLQVLDGLDYAHQAEISAAPLADGGFAPAHGLVHRDIKPSNIFLATSGAKTIAKLGDYGLAKAFDLAGLSGLSMSGDTAGTPAFMPRQQLLDYRNARPEVDVWAVAATLYYMLTLQFPRNFSDDKDRWQVVLQADAVPIRQRDAGIPRALAEVIDAALIEKPALQFTSASELRQALSKAVKKGV